MKQKIKIQLLIGAALISLASTTSLSAADFTKTIANGTTYTSQQNSVTSGTVIVDGTWTPADTKRALANTKTQTGEYGLISVTVGSTGNITTSNGDVFKFTDFTGTMTTAGTTFFKLVNNGNISATGTVDPGRVFQIADVLNGVVEITNNATGTISGAADVFKAAGKIIFTNAGAISAGTGQVIDLGDANTTTISTITNSGTMTSAGNEVISGPANLVIENSGKIESSGTGADAASAIKVKIADAGVNVATTSSAALTLKNFSGAEIIGTKHGVTGDRISEITNAGTISGNGGSGINWDGNVADSPDGGTSFAGASEYYFTLKVTNEAGGIIAGTGDITALDGDGVDVDYSIDLTNAGTIIAKDSPASADSLALGGGRVNNLSTGKISSSNSNDGRAYGILVDDSNEGSAFREIEITNAGTIEVTAGNYDSAAIKLVSDKHNTITNKVGGTISSASGTAILLGSGGDKIVVEGGTIAGKIVGGAGTDTIAIDVGSGNTFSAGGNISNVENLEIFSGKFELKNVSMNGIETLRFVAADSDAKFGSLSVVDGGSISFTENAVLELVFAAGTDLNSFAGTSFELLDGTSAGDDLAFKIFVGDVEHGDWTLAATASGLTLTGTIPEPSLFGVLAGFAALALAGTRRRRNTGKGHACPPIPKSV